MVDGHAPFFAAEIYKTYLHCAAKIIRSEGGEITAFDGDRIMAVFTGNLKNTAATRASLKINYTRLHIINPAIPAHYPNTPYKIVHKVGIDTGPLFVAKTGIRGSNDLVWVGRAANYAAKLTELSADYPTRVTAEVYKRLPDSLKTTNGRPMWEQVTWNTMDDMVIYRSNWWWPL